jgi:hypothetical protein
VSAGGAALRPISHCPHACGLRVATGPTPTTTIADTLIFMRTLDCAATVGILVSVEMNVAVNR